MDTESSFLDKLRPSKPPSTLTSKYSFHPTYRAIDTSDQPNKLPENTSDMDPSKIFPYNQPTPFLPFIEEFEYCPEIELFSTNYYARQAFTMESKTPIQLNLYGPIYPDSNEYYCMPYFSSFPTFPLLLETKNACQTSN